MSLFCAVLCLIGGVMLGVMIATPGTQTLLSLGGGFLGGFGLTLGFLNRKGEWNA